MSLNYAGSGLENVQAFEAKSMGSVADFVLSILVIFCLRKINQHDHCLFFLVAFLDTIQVIYLDRVTYLGIIGQVTWIRKHTR